MTRFIASFGKWKKVPNKEHILSTDNRAAVEIVNNSMQYENGRYLVGVRSMEKRLTKTGEQLQYSSEMLYS